LDWSAAAAAGSSAAASALPAFRPLCGVVERNIFLEIAILTFTDVQQAKKHGKKAEIRHDVGALKKNCRVARETLVDSENSQGIREGFETKSVRVITVYSEGTYSTHRTPNSRSSALLVPQTSLCYDLNGRRLAEVVR
jgi:hypothetical protein